MNKLLLAAAGLATVAGLAVLLPPNAGSAQIPGGGKGEAITIPLGQPTPPGPAGYLPTTPGFDRLPAEAGRAPYAALATEPYPTAAVGQTPQTAGDTPKSLREYLSQKFDEVDPNQDIAIQPTTSPWVICINWYSGPEAAKMARAMVLELRSNPDYKLPAYVFTRGTEERKAELKRIAECVERERKRLADAGLSPDTPIRVPVVRYEMQCAVVIAGYRDMESARRDLDRLKKLKKLDPTKVAMHQELVVAVGKRPNETREEYVPVNPFTHGLVVPNPSLPAARANGPSAEDTALMRSLNEDETFSLLKCPRKYTLAVKQFSMPVVIESKKSSSSMFNLGLGGANDKVDAARVSAHNLADLLRKSKIYGEKCDAFVLHTRYCSYVTVGNFSSPDDPQLRRLQEELPKLNRQLDPSIQLVARPVVMEVPK